MLENGSVRDNQLAVKSRKEQDLSLCEKGEKFNIVICWSGLRLISGIA